MPPASDNLGDSGPAVDEDVLNVLLIEDDPAIAEMYRLRLTADGYAVGVAADGVDGLRRARTELPDLIYLDLRLPELDGLQVLEQLRASPETASIPVVILTNYSDASMIERSFALGALEFLVKVDTSPDRLAELTSSWVAEYK